MVPAAPAVVLVAARVDVGKRPLRRPAGSYPELAASNAEDLGLVERLDLVIAAFGFARWVETNRERLITLLGPGLHFGEWWGSGIQRGYGLTKGDKRFSLFNVERH